MEKYKLTDATTASTDALKIPYVGILYDPMKKVLNIGSKPKFFSYVHNIAYMFYPDIDDTEKGLEVHTYQKARVRYIIYDIDVKFFNEIMLILKKSRLYKIENIASLNRLI